MPRNLNPAEAARRKQNMKGRCQIIPHFSGPLAHREGVQVDEKIAKLPIRLEVAPWFFRVWRKSSKILFGS